MNQIKWDKDDDIYIYILFRVVIEVLSREMMHDELSEKGLGTITWRLRTREVLPNKSSTTKYPELQLCTGCLRIGKKARIANIWP